MCQKPVPEPFLLLVNISKQPLHASKYFEIRYFERGLPKSLKKSTLFFLPNPVSFNNGQSYQKLKGSGTSNQLLFRSQNKLRKIPLLFIYYLTKFDDVI